ncbi:transcriptional regulator [Amycolatopsis tucumanensis]|uniref:HTH cro/C1-type domain-containing protein n=1 Tax=Amycolatopsis tucumanensis TaxID=401106 RepID=A0ABP7HD96_9PSEU|nr:helix-turn-helix transcriptional regulator [Amycolatopsis tucumanensis]MCF6423676.1 transcriptional regulator [Amycolatopsis tucumanensis]
MSNSQGSSDIAAQELGRRLRALREDRGLSVREAAAHVRKHTGQTLTRGELTSVEEGSLRRLTMEFVDALAELYRTAPETLFAGLTLGQRVWLLRRHRGMTQAELAAAITEYTGAVRSRQYISKLEKDDLQAPVSKANLRALAQVLRKPLGFLTGSDDAINDAERELLSALRDLKRAGVRGVHIHRCVTPDVAGDLLDLARTVRNARADLSSAGAATFRPR